MRYHMKSQVLDYAKCPYYCHLKSLQLQQKFSTKSYFAKWLTSIFQQYVFVHWAYFGQKGIKDNEARQLYRFCFKILHSAISFYIILSKSAGKILHWFLWHISLINSSKRFFLKKHIFFPCYGCKPQRQIDGCLRKEGEVSSSSCFTFSLLCLII